MALDQALLEAVDAEPQSAYFRTYGWREPTLSLGYFQKLAEVEADPRWRGVPIVRRPSGGGALWHHHELTYALVVPRIHRNARRASDLYRAVHAAIASLLAECGFEAARRGQRPHEDDPSVRPFLCFTDRDPEDILTEGMKIVGSAQRRRPRAVLQHGSLLLARSDRTPELPGLVDLAGPRAAELPWPSLFRERIAQALDLVPRDANWTPSHQESARMLRCQVYQSPSWTRRR